MIRRCEMTQQLLVGMDGVSESAGAPGGYSSVGGSALQTGVMVACRSGSEGGFCWHT
jgi:hypothetical protein